MKKSQSLYIPTEMLAEVRREAARQERSVSWVLIAAWRRAVERIRQIPEPPK